jgi:hypothetical protein
VLAAGCIKLKKNIELRNRAPSFSKCRRLVAHGHPTSFYCGDLAHQCGALLQKQTRRPVSKVDYFPIPLKYGRTAGSIIRHL